VEGCAGSRAGPLHAPAFADSVRPVIDAVLVDPVAADMALTADIRLTRTPRHTPGHMSMWIADRCVITGDVLHHPIQCRLPEWTARGDVDTNIARATRQGLLEAAATTNVLIFGTHFAGPRRRPRLSTEDGYSFAAEAGRCRSRQTGYELAPHTAASEAVPWGAAASLTPAAVTTSGTRRFPSGHPPGRQALHVVS
jgi:glyoxylase-like metal-dependent hydrolase (beta-lactamase superfamily II)